MLRIMVTGYYGSPPLRPIVADFDEMGGKIGRADDNTLVLPDVHRYISRTHAHVFFRGGSYLIRDVGSASPVYVNDKQLGTGQQALIGDGDEIRIAGFSLRVVAIQAHATPGSAVHDLVGTAPGTTKDDPLAALGAVASSTDPFADLTPSPPKTSSRSAGGMTPAPPRAGRDPNPPSPAAKLGVGNPAPSPIPEDFDPFAEPFPAPPSEVGSIPDNLDLGTPGGSQKIDELYGLSEADRQGSFDSGSPLEPNFGQVGNPQVLDPLVALGGVPLAKPSPFQPQRDNTPELHGSFRLPHAVENPPASEPARDKPFRVSDEGQSSRARSEPVSDHQPGYEAGPAPVDTSGRQKPVSPPPYVGADGAASRGDAGSSPTGKAPEAGANRKIAQELLASFLSGAGVPEVEIPGGLTPQLMHMLGQLVRENTRGTLDLLLARSAVKRQLRIPVTMIVARENNPLKFSPNVEAALTQLLAPPGRGFMTPLRATRDAYNDLRCHEVGFLAGMRAALTGVLTRFSPEELQKRLTRKTVLDSLVPMNRDAKLWALFEELYADISNEAEDNFHNLFGREFMRAYEAQIERLEEEERTPKA